MSKAEMLKSFPPGVAEKLKFYVYRLIDPRNGETFYVGKGEGNRVFVHVCEEIDSDDPSNKLNRIREIRLAGFKVSHVIHRHGLDEKTAFEVEAALIDAYPGLTNEVAGHHSNECGTMHAQEIIDKYQAKQAEFKHRAVIINVNRSAGDELLYEATRYAWRISRTRAERAEIVVAVHRGVIVGVYVAEKWLEATKENFPGHEPAPGRYGFVGHEAPEAIWQIYYRKRLPDRFRQRGAANPIKYTYR